MQSRDYQKGYAAGRRRGQQDVKSALKPPKCKSTPQNLICQAADYDVELALVMWKISSTRLFKRTLELIPDSKATWALYRSAKAGEEPLCNWIRP